MGDVVRRGTRWYVRYRDADVVRRMWTSYQPTHELARCYLLNRYPPPVCERPCPIGESAHERGAL